MTLTKACRANDIPPAPPDDWRVLSNLPDELVVSFQSQGEEQELCLRGGHAYIGRLQSLRLQAKLSGVSERHVKLCWVEGQRSWTVEDLGSTNGTHLNGSALHPGEACSLANGDTLLLGGILKVSIEVRPLSTQSSLRELLHAKGKAKADEQRAEAEDSIVEIRGNWDDQKQAFCDSLGLHEDHPARE